MNTKRGRVVYDRGKHLFKWKDMYRLVQNMASPEIEETKSAEYADEWAALWGTYMVVFGYYVEATIPDELFSVGKSTVFGLYKKLVDTVLPFGSFVKELEKKVEPWLPLF